METLDILYWQDFATGQSLEVGDYMVSEQEIITFAKQFDPQPFHVDPKAAKASLFGDLCASGWHTGAIAMRILYDALLHRTASLGSPGLESLAWHAPVFAGDRLSVKIRVLESRSSESKPQLGIIKQSLKIYNQHGEKVMSFVGHLFVAKKVL